eukprot:437998_1
MKIFTSIIVLILAVVIGTALYLLQFNVKNYGEISVVTTAPTMEKYLAKHKSMIGKVSEHEYLAYRAHLYRVLTYSIYFLENEYPLFKANKDKYKELMEVALVYHDIGIWANDEVNHVYPSIRFMNKQKFDDYSPEDTQLIYDIARYHHKITPYTSDTLTINNAIINAVRISNTIDLFHDTIHMGLSSKHIDFVMEKIPDPGFHGILLRLANGNRFYMLIEFVKMITF